MTLVHRYRLQFFECMSRPYNHLRVKADGNQNRRVVRPPQILNIVVVADQSPDSAPVLDRGCLVRAYMTFPESLVSALLCFQRLQDLPNVDECVGGLASSV